LVWFWAAILVAVAAGGGTLQYLGPPEAVVVHSNAPPPAADPPAPGPPPPVAAKLPEIGPVHTPNAPILPPDAALLEPIPGGDSSLPRIGADGRAPMRVYAAGYDPADRRPRVAILLANIAMGEQDSEEAIKTLPSAISLAVSPYASHPGRLLELARATGHELLIGIPMEPQGYPMNDPGALALTTGLSPAENAAKLRQVLSLFNGYAGATGAIGNGLRGARYAASAQIVPMLQELARRGVFYIDPRPGGALPAAGGGLASRAVDLVLDEPPLRTEIEAKLGRLVQLARDHGSALGLADGPSPVTIARISAWGTMLEQQGVVLVPVSALVSLPTIQAKP
jgi:polysaccharide deacetylase 2 family uncharacterized protein YibQ